MATENLNVVNTRITLKIDTFTNWNAIGNTFVPMLGEVCFVQIDKKVEGSELPPVMFKVGDGKTTFAGLSWACAKAADVYDWAKQARLAITTTEEGATNDGKYVNGLVWDKDTHTLKPQMVSFDTVIGEATKNSTNAPTTHAVKEYVDAEVTKAVSGGVEGLATKDYVDGQVGGVQTQIDNLGNTYATNTQLNEVKATAEAATTVDEVNAQIDTKITVLNLGATYEPIGAETRAKTYADGLITDANLGQYTTEQEVKDIVDGVIAGAVDGDTITGLANLVEYLNTHGSEAKEMAAAIDVLEGKVETIEDKPAYDITVTQISNWDNEVGAKATIATYGDIVTHNISEFQPAGDYQPAGNYKTTQEVVAETGAADKTLKIGQNANGEISVTPVDIAIAATQVSGLATIATSGSINDVAEVNIGTDNVKYLVFNCGSATTLID